MSISFNLGLFILCMIVATSMVVYKMWLFKKGEIDLASYEEADWTDLAVESIRKRTLEIIKITVHKFVLWTLKAWIISAHFIKRCDRSVRQKLINFLKKNSHYTKNTDQKPSDFISEIKVHHDEVVKNMTAEHLE